MFRLLFASFCSLSLLVCAAATAVIVHSHRSWHQAVWRADERGEADGAHGSLGSIWREYRARGGVPGLRGARPCRPAGLDPAMLAPAMEYASLSLADGKVQYLRYPAPSPDT